MSKALATKNVAAVLLGVGMILSVFAFATPAKAQSVGDLQSQINALLAQIAALQGGSSSSTSCAFTFTANLKLGSKGTEVMNLQKFLNMSADTRVAASGAGSPGNETSTFGPATKAAVIKFQEKYAADVLTPSGLSKGTGNWFAATRAKANMLCTSTGGSTGGNTGGNTTPGTLMVTAGSQPANSLAPAGATRVPFTNFTLTNSSASAVTINGIVITRAGLASDAVFSGVVLLDQNGLQIGTPRTFDTNHQATIGDTMTIQPGQSMTFTVAGNMASNLSSYAGQVAALNVTGVNTTGTVSGSLPISGANQTINASLAIGTVTLDRSSFDPNNATTKNIGDTAVKFSGVRVTAGSAEDIRVFSIRWRLNGSASASDVSNVMTVIGGTSYPTVLSADGRYYTTTVPGGVLVAKGNSTEIYIQGDITGSNSNSRVIEFDIDRPSDVYIVGQTYGYGITPTANSYVSTTPSSASTHASGFYGSSSAAAQPFFQGSTFSVQGSSVTTIARASEVPAQNVSVNVPNQVLGGFVADIKGEALTVQTVRVNVSSTGTSTVGELQSVSLVDDTGAVLAGPVDAVGSVITFNNSITFKSGRHVYTIKGKIPTGTSNGATFTLNTTPSAWTGVTGQVSGNTYTISTGNFTMNTMTVRGATVTITASAQPAAQTIVAGGQAVTLANIQIDASQSGEDIRMNSLPVNFGNSSNAAALSSCQAYNGSTILNSGSNTITTAATTTTFVFDNSLSIAKGSVVTITIKCNVASNSVPGSVIQAGVLSSLTYSATGVQSGNTVTPTVTTGNSGVQTVGTSALAVSQDSSAPSYAITAGGTTGVTVNALRLRATGEDMTLNELGLTVSAGGNADVVRATIWNGATQVGSVVFTSAATSTATSTLSTPVTLTANTDVVLTIKADVQGVGVGQSGTAGNLVQVNYSGAKATGNNSGNTVYSTGSAVSAGARLERSYPTVALVSLPSTGVLDGRLIRFTVSANAAGSVTVNKFTFNVASTTGVTVANMNLYGYSGAACDTGALNAGNALNTSPVAASASASVSTNNVTNGVVTIPAGSTYCFELRATVTSSQTAGSVSTTLLGDSSYTRGTTGITGNFIWSPNSTTTVTSSANDFVTGYGVPGLPSSGITQTRNQ